MAEPFHKRFDIEVPIEEARRRFVNRLRLYSTQVIESQFVDSPMSIMRRIKIELGEEHVPYRYDAPSTFIEHWDGFVNRNFLKALQITEAFYSELKRRWGQPVANYLDEAVKSALVQSEVDLDISWEKGSFRRQGAVFLDERVVNDPLHWLREDRNYHNVLVAFEKGLMHFLEAQNSPERYGDTVTDMYESLEAMAKIVTERDKDLSANTELFISRLNLPAAYKVMFKQFVDFGCDYRHAPGSTQRRVNPTPKDTEAFVYMTGLFLRLALQSRL